MWQGETKKYPTTRQGGHCSPPSYQARPSSLQALPYAALIATTPGSTLLQAKWRAVFLFSSNTVRSAFPRYSRNSIRERGQRGTDTSPQEHLGSPPSCLHILCIPSSEGKAPKTAGFLNPTSRATPSCKNPKEAPPFHTQPLHTHSSGLPVLSRHHERSAASMVSGVHLGLMLQ